MRNKHLPKPNIQKGYNAFAFGRITLLLLLFSSLSLPRSLAQLVIDEFNTGGFTVQGPNGTGANASVPTGIIGGVRTVQISDNGSPTTPSTMSLNPSDGYMKLLIGNTSGVYEIGWGNLLGTVPLNLDISAYDRVILTLSQAPANSQAFIKFFLKTSFITSTSTTLTGAGTYSFPTFGRSNINGIGITFSGGGLPANSSIHVESITFTSTCAPILTAPSVTQPTCAAPTGSITVNATGNSALEYSINNGTSWSPTATFSGLSAGNYNIKARLQASPTCMATYANPVVLNSPFSASTTTDTWTGCISTDWATAANWADGSVPTAADDVVIPNTTNKPTIFGGTAAVGKSIEVQTGTTLTIAATASLTVNGSKSISGNTIALFNSGTVTNSGQVAIGSSSMADVGKYGIRNEGTFTNSTGGNIQIDRSTDTGLYNEAGSFTNLGNITIGASAAIGKDGLFNRVIFSNTGMGLIQIDRSFSAGISNLFSATFTNSASITIGSLASVGTWGLLNQATFTNNTGGDIKIDNATGTGLYNSNSFTNVAKITIGATASIGGEGIDNRGTFNNNTGGDIKIDRTGRGLLNHTATFNNAALITIGASASVGQRGLNNFGSAAMFNNNAGEIKIDNATSIDLYNESGTFTNAAKITIGATASAGMAQYGIINPSTFNNNTGGQITIDRVTFRGIQNDNPFSNAGEIRIGATAITAQDCIRNTSSFINQSGGRIYLDRAWGNGIWHTGNSFQNSGEIILGSIANTGVGILNRGPFSNNGSIQLDRVSRGLTNTSTFNNAGQILMGNNVALGERGLLNGNGSGTVLAVFNNLAGSLLQIDQTAANQDGITNELLTTFTNAGTVNIGTLGSIGGNGINNAGTFSNSACATLTVFDNLKNSNTFTNTGLFTVNTNQTHTNTALTNNGIINYPQDNPIPNVTNNDLIVAPITGCNTITPALQIGGMNSFTVGTTWYKDQSLTQVAGTYNQATNTFTATQLAAGSTYSLYFSITAPVGMCSHKVGISVTLNPLSVAPLSISGISTICQGNSTTLTLVGGSAGTGAIVEWSASSCGGTVIGTGNSITVSPSTPTTYFVKYNGACNVTACASQLINVNTPSTAPLSISGISTICQGNSTTLTLVGGSAGSGATADWSANSCDGVVIGAGNSITVSPSTPTTYFVKYNGTCNVTACASQLINVNTPSTAPLSISGISTICQGNSTTLTLVGGSAGTGAIAEWSASSCSGTVIGTGNSITVSPSTPTTYFVKYNGTCNVTACASQLINVNTPSTAPLSISGISTICSGGSTTLTLSGGFAGTGAVAEWFTSSCGGTPAGTGNSIIAAPTVNTTYFVRYKGICNTTSCASVAVVITTPSAGGTVAPAQSQGCGLQTVNLSVSGIIGAVTQWERQTNCTGAWTSIGSANL